MNPTQARWLEAAELDAHPDWLGPLGDRFGPAPGGVGWPAAVRAAMTARGMQALGLEREGRLVGALLTDPHAEVRTVLAGIGALDTEALQVGLRALQLASRALLWDETTGTGWQAASEPLGVRPYVRQVYTQAVARATFRELPEGDVRVLAWQPGDWSDAVPLLATANVGTLDGLFLTAPRWPSVEACEAVLTDALSGGLGSFLPEASLVARRDGRLVGVLITVAGERDGEAILFEVAVHPEARGLQLSRRLIQGLQHAVIGLGLREITFLTTSENAPVHRLFEPETIVRYEESCGAYWFERG